MLGGLPETLFCKGSFLIAVAIGTALRASSILRYKAIVTTLSTSPLDKVCPLVGQGMASATPTVIDVLSKLYPSVFDQDNWQSQQIDIFLHLGEFPLEGLIRMQSARLEFQTSTEFWIGLLLGCEAHFRHSGSRLHDRC